MPANSAFFILPPPYFVAFTYIDEEMQKTVPYTLKYSNSAEKQKEKATVVKTVACVGAIYLSGPSPAKYCRQK